MTIKNIGMMTKTLVIGLIGSAFFSFLHLPLPWLLGPVTSLLLLKFIRKEVEIYWPPQLRNVGFAVLGIFLGSSFTPELGQKILFNLLPMLIITVVMIICGVLSAFLISRYVKYPFPSTLIGSIPGGFSQMILVADETKSADLTIVTVMQTIRLITIMFATPLLVFYGLNKEVTKTEIINSTEVTNYFEFKHIIFILILIGCLWIAVKIKMPSSYLMGSMLVTAVFTMLEFPKPILPNEMFIVSQIFIGCYLSTNLEIKKMLELKKLCLFAIFASVALIICALVLGLILRSILSIPLTTAFLSIAPGGVTEISIIAASVDADLSIVTSYQLFRLFFILFLIPPLLKWWIHKNQMKNEVKLQQLKEKV
jgi:uncharacterized protein